MTREEILAGLSHAEASVAAWHRLLAEHDGAPCALAPVAPEPDDPDDWISTAVAARIAKVSYSTLYRWADKFNIGKRTRSGQRKISRRALMAVVAVSRCGEIGDNGDSRLVPMATRELQNALPLFPPPEPPND